MEETRNTCKCGKPAAAGCGGYCRGHYWDAFDEEIERNPIGTHRHVSPVSVEPSDDMFISAGFVYSMFNFERAKELFKSPPIFLPISCLRAGDEVMIPAPFRKNVKFLGKKWEISGDHCCFNVKEVGGDVVVLLPSPSMASSRGDGMQKEEFAIEIRKSNNLILMTRWPLNFVEADSGV